MRRSKLLPAIGLGVLLAAVATVSWKQRQRTVSSTAELLPYQALVRTLPPAEKARFLKIRAALLEAEQVRGQTHRWPPDFAVPGLTWVQRGHGLYVNYLGVPADPTQRRWLVLLIEPEPTALKDKPAAPDEEHHTLADGVGIHVSVWSAPNEGLLPEVVLPFPAAEDWTQYLVGPGPEEE